MNILIIKKHKTQTAGSFAPETIMQRFYSHKNNQIRSFNRDSTIRCLRPHICDSTVRLIEIF